MIALFSANIVVGTAWHEVVGHGLVGVACGGDIKEIVVTGIQLWPEFDWVGTGGAFGTCDVQGVSAGICDHLWLLTGSLSTAIVAGIACLLLKFRAWESGHRFLLVGCAFWWIDLLTYTLPSLGVRRFLLFGRRHAEPYNAAVALGIPGWFFQLLVFAACSLIAFCSIRELLRWCGRQSLAEGRGSFDE